MIELKFENIGRLVAKYRHLKKGKTYKYSYNEEKLYEEFELMRSEYYRIKREDEYLKKFALIGMMVKINGHDMSSMASRILSSSTLNECKDSFRAFESKINNFYDMDVIEDRLHNIFAIDIENFVESYFKTNIEINLSSDFNFKYINKAKFYTLIVNILENALYFKKDKIVIYNENNTLIIYNDGEHIKDLNKIFDFGYSKRMCGNGIGLSISKELNKRLKIEAKNCEDGVRFLITKEDK